MRVTCRPLPIRLSSPLSRHPYLVTSTSSPVMTYCVAALVEEGIVFASDSRTSAGFDNIATFSKMNVFEVPGERVVVILSSGNLATTQGVIARLKMRARDGHGASAADGILGVAKMFEAAQLVGRTLHEVVHEAA